MVVNEVFDKMYFGGGFGLDFNQNVFSFSLTPYAGYKLTERWSAGLGINYQFWRDKIFDLKINNYGGQANIFARGLTGYNVGGIIGTGIYNVLYDSDLLEIKSDRDKSRL